MAKMDVSGMDAVLAEMKSLGMLIGETADEMLEAGGQIIVEAWQESAEKHDLVDSGDMIDSMGFKPPKRKGDTREIVVYPQGKDSRGNRNAEKAFIHNYGSSRVPATHWVDDAEALAEDRVVQECEKIMDRAIMGRD